jgi:hypothetical protein
MRCTRFFGWSAALVAVLSIAAVGCGGSDDSGDAAAQQKQAQDVQPSSDGGSNAQEDIRNAVARMQNRFYAGDPKGVCEMHTAAGQKAVAAAGDSGATCEDVMKIYAVRVPAVKAAQYKARIVSVKVDGDSAIVTTVQSQAQKPAKSRMAKENGQWKIDQGLSGP